MPTQTQREVWANFGANGYVSPEIVDNFRDRLQVENSLQSPSIALENFLNLDCPTCSISGMYKFNFLGRLRHPACGWQWYVNPGTYMVEHLKRTFRTGSEVGGDIASDIDKKGEKGGCVGATFGFIFGALFRLFFAILMMPVQAIVSLAQQKPNPTKRRRFAIAMR